MAKVLVASAHSDTPHEVDMDAAAVLMDDELRERLASELNAPTEQEFVDAYAKLHAEKYGTPFVVD